MLSTSLGICAQGAELQLVKLGIEALKHPVLGDVVKHTFLG
jgi:hypothetical protein